MCFTHLEDLAEGEKGANFMSTLFIYFNISYNI